MTVLLSLGVMAPYLGEGIYQNGDLWNFLGGVVEARNALVEGQFPIRVAPHQLEGQRYPVFQFYANLPYTVAGAVLEPDGRNPYAAWKWTFFAALVIGGLSLHRLVWRWTRSQPAAIASVAVFLSAPYLMTNLNDRGAVAEAFGLCLLPSALLATWTCLTRPGWWRPAVCAIAWTALGLTHNITYLYGATFVGMLILSMLRPRRRQLRRVGRLGLAAVLHALLLAWYVAPQLVLMPDLAIASNLTSPGWSAELVPLSILLWPVCRTPDMSTIPRLGLQIGWLVMAGLVAAAVVHWRARRRPVRGADGEKFAIAPSTRRDLRRGLMVRLLTLSVVAIALLWNPVDLWPLVPKPFYFIQFTYRLLGFVLLFGALLMGLAIGTHTVDRPGRGWLVMSGVLFAASVTQFAYNPPGLYHPRGAHRWINDKPQLGGLGDYLLRPRESAALPPDVDRVPPERFTGNRKPGARPVFRAVVARATRVVLPVLAFPQMQTVIVDDRPQTYGVDGRHITVDLEPGHHVIAVEFNGLEWANQASVLGAMAAMTLIAWRLGMAVPPLWKSRR